MSRDLFRLSALAAILSSGLSFLTALVSMFAVFIPGFLELSSYALPAALPGPASTGLYAAPVAGPACTSFRLDNGGYPIHGANLEHGHVYKGLLYVNRRNIAKEGLDPATTGEIARWTSRYGSLTFNLVGYEFPWGGMNEAGLSFSTMSLRESQSPAPDKRPPLQEPLYAQYLLDNCSTVEEVMATSPWFALASRPTGPRALTLTAQSRPSTMPSTRCTWPTAIGGEDRPPSGASSLTDSSCRSTFAPSGPHRSVPST